MRYPVVIPDNQEVDHNLHTFDLGGICRLNHLVAMLFGSFLIQGQGEVEARPFANFAFSPDLSAMSLDEVFA